MAVAMVLIVGCVFIFGSMYISKSTLNELDQVENRILRARHFSEEIPIRKPEPLEAFIHDNFDKINNQ